MQGTSLPADKIDELFMVSSYACTGGCDRVSLNHLKGVGRILDQLSWQQRGRTECTCGQTALFACSDCSVPDLCQVCMVAAHQGLPFHSIRVILFIFLSV
jgi:hypothetical protein